MDIHCGQMREKTPKVASGALATNQEVSRPLTRSDVPISTPAFSFGEELRVVAVLEIGHPKQSRARGESAGNDVGDHARSQLTGERVEADIDRCQRSKDRIRLVVPLGVRIEPGRFNNRHASIAHVVEGFGAIGRNEYTHVIGGSLSDSRNQAQEIVRSSEPVAGLESNG